MKRKKSAFLKRALLLGGGAVLLFIAVVLAVYPYERVIERMLADVARDNNVLISPARTEFSFPNKVTFHNLRIVPGRQPYHLLETEFTSLTAQIGLRALLTRRLRVRFSGQVHSGDPDDGDYDVSGIVTLLETGDEGPDGGSKARAVQFEGFRLTGTDVNFAIDGRVTSSGEILNPVLDLTISVEKLGRTDSANYGIDNLLKFVRSCFQDETELPVTFTLTGPFSEPTLNRVTDGGVQTDR